MRTAIFIITLAVAALVMGGCSSEPCTEMYCCLAWATVKCPIHHTNCTLGDEPDVINFEICVASDEDVQNFSTCLKEHFDSCVKGNHK